MYGCIGAVHPERSRGCVFDFASTRGFDMTLSDQELERYARHIVLPQVGGVGQNKLRAASVAVIGAGGIGSAVIPALAGAGVGG